MAKRSSPRKRKKAKKAKKAPARKKASRSGSRIRKSSLPDVKKGDLLDRSVTIMRSAHESASAFAAAFDSVRRERGATVGAPTDEEQDLLRAMLVMAAAGLDSAIKQLIRDTLPELVECDDRVVAGLESFVARQVRGDVEGTGAAAGSKFLAKVLVAPSQQKQVIEEYILDLTGSSLQSAEELMKAANALGLEPTDHDLTPKTLQPIFSTRNKIIHELDINFEAARRNRESRKQPDMLTHSNRLLKIGESFVKGVAEKLKKKGAA